MVHELPGVGENLQDHFGIGLEFRSTLKETVNDLYNNPLRGGWQLLRYLLFRTGPFADNGNYSNTFIRSSPDIPTPDMMITFMAWCTDETLKPRPFSGFTILAEHMRPGRMWPCPYQGTGTGSASSHPVQLLRIGSRPSGGARRTPVWTEDFADPAPVRPYRARDFAWHGCVNRRGVDGLLPPSRIVAAASGRNLQNGNRRRCRRRYASTGTWRGTAPSCGRLDHAENCYREYQRRGDHDRGKGRGPYPRGFSLTAAASRRNIVRTSLWAVRPSTILRLGFVLENGSSGSDQSGQRLSTPCRAGRDFRLRQQGPAFRGNPFDQFVGPAGFTLANRLADGPVGRGPSFRHVPGCRPAC